MRLSIRTASPRALAWLLSWVCASPAAFGQDHEPRRWTHLPIDTNVIAVSYAYTNGDLAFDPALRIEDAEFQIHTTLLGFSGYFGLFGSTARVDVLLPFQYGQWNGLVNGEPTTVRRDGMADPFVRFSCNLIGAPAIEAKDFPGYRKEHGISTTLGAAIDVRLPLGEYMDDKLINLGQNRFAIAPQVGLLHTRHDWSFELMGSTIFYTKNDDFFGGNELEQDPLYALQAHVVKIFENSVWISTGVAYGWGGESSLNGSRLDDERSNLLYGASFGFPIAATQGLRAGYLGTDTLTDVGADAHTLYLTWSMRF